MEKNVVIVGGIRNKESREGKQYLGVTLEAGPLGKIHGALFRNEKKESEKQPDFLLLCDNSEIGAFWLTESRKGEKHFVGKILGVPVRIFRNDPSRENVPDYRIVRFLGEDQKADRGDPEVVPGHDAWEPRFPVVPETGLM